jgi:uncharacterized Fe-S cluster-containing radical SAM superfamily protein
VTPTATPTDGIKPNTDPASFNSREYFYGVGTALIPGCGVIVLICICCYCFNHNKRNKSEGK